MYWFITSLNYYLAVSQKKSISRLESCPKDIEIIGALEVSNLKFLV